MDSNDLAGDSQKKITSLFQKPLVKSSDRKAPEDHFSDAKDNFRAPGQSDRQEEKTTSYSGGALEEGECRTKSGERNSGQKTSGESADDRGHVTLPPGQTSRQEGEMSCLKDVREEDEEFGVGRGYVARSPGHSRQEEKTTSYSRGAMGENEDNTPSRKRNYDKLVESSDKPVAGHSKQEEDGFREDLDISVVDLDSDGGDGFKFVVKPTSEKQGAAFKSKVDEDKSRKRFKSGDSGFSDTATADDVFDSNCGFGEADPGDTEKECSKLDLILKELTDLKQEMKEFKSSRTVFRETELQPGVEEQNSPEVKETLMLLQVSRSMEEIQGIGFEYDEENEKVRCKLCERKPGSVPNTPTNISGEFRYSLAAGLSFDENEKLSRSFINLKAHLKAHILRSKSHCLSLMEEKERNAAECELVSKNRKAGINLGRAAMKNFIQGRPYTDFENDVLLMKKSGGNVGDINHGRKFPAMYRKSVSRVVNGRVRKFIMNPLKATGHLPPVAVSADKGTYKGTPRQFCGLVTINPGGKNFLEIIAAGQPVVSEGSSGAQLAENMKTAFDYIGVSGEQIKSGVFDGVYDHIDIERHLKNIYPDMKKGEFLFTWDPLHIRQGWLINT